MSKKNLTQKLIESHLVDGKMIPGEYIGIKIDQTLAQDATGTMVMLEFEAMKLPKVKTKLSCQYVDHNLIQEDYKNPDDHIFLRSSAQKFGMWFSSPGNGISHPVHMERFAKPGETLLGCDSHTPANGCMGMLAIGAGGLMVAMAMAGKPYYLRMPKVWGVKLTGKLPDWVSAKDVILEMLRRHDVDGGVGKVIEYYGPGLAELTADDRHVIANMGAELGATTTVFPADGEIKRFMEMQGRGSEYVELLPDEGCTYDLHEEINLSELEPLIACPSSPGNVVKVSEVAGKEVHQCYIGSGANAGLRDFGIAANIVAGKQVHERVSFDINPSSRQVLQNMVTQGILGKIISSGARIHQAGCNGCIGMGQAPATGKISLRTTPRNFPGRSGTKEDSVYLCSPEVAAASALKGVITDPRTLDMPYPRFKEPKSIQIETSMMIAPHEDTSGFTIQKGPNIQPLPHFDELANEVSGTVLLKTGDNVSTDEIMPAGAKVLPFRSNIPEISKFVYYRVDPTFYERAKKNTEKGFFIVGGDNYGQGSSREHAAIAPRYLGLKAVVAKSFARIHAQNLINFGMIPLIFKNASDYDNIDQGDELSLPDIRKALESNAAIKLENKTKGKSYELTHNMNHHEIKMILEGGMINLVKKEEQSN